MKFPVSILAFPFSILPAQVRAWTASSIASDLMLSALLKGEVTWQYFVQEQGQQVVQGVANEKLQKEIPTWKRAPPGLTFKVRPCQLPSPACPCSPLPGPSLCS